MHRKKPLKRLSLSRLTVHTLDDRAKARVEGGTDWWRDEGSWACYTNSCHCPSEISCTTRQATRIRC